MTRAIGETASPIRPFRSLLGAGQQPIRVAVDNAKLQISRHPKERTGQTERDPLRGVSPPSPKERAEREVKPKETR